MTDFKDMTTDELKTQFKEYDHIVNGIGICSTKDNMILDWTERELERRGIRIIENKSIEFDDSEELSECVECGCMFEQETDIQLCDKCMDLFDLDRLWKMHDNKQINALDFNESKEVREMFRIREVN